MEKDSLRRFILANTQVRGEWVHLDATWQALLTSNDYPDVVKKILGEALAAVVLLSATIKYQGSLILQIKGSGAVHLLVVQADSEGSVRGLARYKNDALSNLPIEPSLPDLLSNDAMMVITIQPNNGSKPYQGIVALNGDTMQACLQAYFEQSEQLATRLYLAADANTCTGLLLQRLPEQADDKDGWNRATILANTLSEKDLLTWNYDMLLQRLYHEEQVTLFDRKEIRFQCTCSVARIEGAIQTLGETEAQDIINEQGYIQVDCEFCNKDYRFDRVDIKRIFTPDAIKPSQNSTH
jgi:molecular chaperone Hsp33